VLSYFTDPLFIK